MVLSFYLVKYLGVPQDNHTLFVRPNLFKGEAYTERMVEVHVDIKQGVMRRSEAYFDKPEGSPTFVVMNMLDKVSGADLEHADQVCRSRKSPADPFDGPLNPSLR
jgi:hypothetical protein